MKAKATILALAMVAIGATAQAQHVSVRLNFPVGYHTRAYGRAPFSGAVWIGPEWEWRNGRYESIEGHWGRPPRRHSVWIAGHWQASRRGYRWIPGHWS